MDMQKELERIKAEVKEEVMNGFLEQQKKAQAEQDKINNDPFQKKLQKYK